jgi:hypothetical protein
VVNFRVPRPVQFSRAVDKLLYELVATLPTPTDDSFLGQLESAGFVPGGDAAATRALDCRLGGFWVPRTMSRSLIKAFAEGRPERQEAGPPSMNWIEAEFTALRYFTVDGK